MLVKKPSAESPIYQPSNAELKVFLGGSIEMGKAERWQDYVIERLSGWPDNLEVLNPRRDDWDSSWEQIPEKGNPFYDQVTWEMDAQENADFMVYYFAPDTISPITLLELGAYASSEDTIVCVNPGYERYGNVVMFCEYYDIPYVTDIEDVIVEINARYMKIL
jgi:hypothetical protein